MPGSIAKLMDLITHRISTATTNTAVLFVDLDQFKFVNDTLGHGAGDRYLIEVARRLVGCARDEDTVARIGGDEFLLICPAVTSVEQAQLIGNQIVQALRHPLLIQGTSVSLSVSVGIEVHLPGTHPAPEDLIANADLAMHAAKRSGRNSIAVYDASLRADAADRMSLEVDLHDAVDRGELFCAYQPVVDMSDGRLIGVETLARWTSDTRGDVPPAVFITAAEDNGQIGSVGEFVLRTACAQMAAWRVLDPAWANVALEDFGTGFSSLAQLRDLPADVLKIDRSFVTDLERDPAAAGIIRAILTLARTLHVHVTAEGIETDEQRQILLALGCRYGQGFLWSEPPPPEQFNDRAEEYWLPTPAARDTDGGNPGASTVRTGEGTPAAR